MPNFENRLDLKTAKTVVVRRMVGMDNWKPKGIIDIEDVLRTSTRPFVALLEDGEKILFKSPHNPVGVHSLVCEFVGTSLARLLDIPTFTFCIFHSDSLNTLKGKRFFDAPGDGIGIMTKWESGTTWKDTPEVFNRIRNKNDATKIIFFDTWVRNKDRYFVESDNRVITNTENLFFSGNVLAKKGNLMKAIDHTEAFKGFSERISSKHFQIDCVKDPAIFGLFPEFQGILDSKTAIETLTRLSQIQRKYVHKIIEQIPDEWDVDNNMRNALLDFVMQRALYVADTLFTRLFGPRTNQKSFLQETES